MNDQAHREREGFFGAAKVIAALTVGSRILGMLRDMALTSLGASRATSAFVLAMRIPNLFRRLFGEGALSAAFVPVFTDTSERDGRASARRLFANALGLLAAFLVALMVLIQLGLWVWIAVAPGAWDRRLLVHLTSIMLPFMVTVCLLALGSAALNCRGHFAYPAFAPILLNVFIIAAAWGVAPTLAGGDVVAQLYVIAPSFTVAGIVQLGGVLWLLRAAGMNVLPRLRPVHAGIRPMLRLMAPMLLGLGFLQFAELLNDVIAWLLAATETRGTFSLFGAEIARPLEPGVLMRVYAAQRLYQFPMGVLAISLAVAVFPLLSRYASRGEMGQLRGSLNRALRLTLMEGLAAGAGLFVLAGPVTRLIFAHRNFTDADAAASASILRLYVLGMWAYCTRQILLRAYYAMKDTATPLKIACAMIAANLAMVLTLVWFVGAGAFGLATSIAASVEAVILTIVLRGRVGPFGGAKLAASLARSAVATGAMVAAVWMLRDALAPYGDAAVVAACVPAGAIVFVVAARLMRAPELGELRGALAARGRSPDEDDSPPDGA